jgi:hypothetical protein
MQKLNTNLKKVNFYSAINIDNYPYKVVNQLNDEKNISNFYLPRKLVKPHPTSPQARTVIKSKYITNLDVCLKKCFLGKANKHYLVGVDMFFTY